MGFHIVDGMLKDRWGNWLSYAYCIDQGRIMFLTYFDHLVTPNETFVSFIEAR